MRIRPKDLRSEVRFDIKGCNVYYPKETFGFRGQNPKKKFTPICKYMSEQMCNNYLELIRKQRD
jgi:hypothetical protein